MAAKNKKRRKKLSFGIIVFSFTFIYLVIHILMYVFTEKTSIYEVGRVTSFDADKTFTGLILRDETVYTAEYQGLVNYFLGAGGKTAVDDVIYSIDETGEFNDLLSSETGVSGLGSEQLAVITGDLALFSMNYNSNSFSDVYTLKSDISSRLVSFLDISSEEAVAALGLDARYFHTYKSDASAVVEYYHDGYEDFDAASARAEDFSGDSYQKTLLKNGMRVDAGEFVYKTINSEQWSILFRLEDADAEAYKDSKRLNVRFDDIDAETIVLFEEITGADGGIYGKITLTKYMIRYADSRFLAFTVLGEAPKGYKIPNTAIAARDYYAIPVDYVAKGGNTQTEGFFVATVSTSGESVSFEPTGIAYRDDNYVYINKDEIALGSVIIMPDSEERCAVSATASLPGVYRVNQGYASFCIIEELDKNSEYTIVSSTTAKGITEYDRIFLSAEKAADGQKIY